MPLKTTRLPIEKILNAYARGIFPMAESKNDDGLNWYRPERRGIFLMGGFHISRSLKRALCKDDYTIRLNTAFEGVLKACARRPETWINAPLCEIYQALYLCGAAHSLEVWRAERLIGGVFGVTVGGAFFGESMFSNARDGSKIALCWLMDRLERAGFLLFDTQFITPHLASLGGVEISRKAYEARLKVALPAETDFLGAFQPSDGAGLLAGIKQRSTQTS